LENNASSRTPSAPDALAVSLAAAMAAALAAALEPAALDAPTDAGARARTLLATQSASVTMSAPDSGAVLTPSRNSSES